MFPIALDLTKIPILLIGQGELLTRRQKQLQEEGATKLYTCHPREGGDPRQAFESWLGVDASLRWHDSKVIMVAGLERSIAEIIVEQAHLQGKLVNVEDVNDLCDFYFTANVRRGDLVIAVSTSGASPTLARKVRDYIARRFGVEWAGYIEEMKQRRLQLRAQGKTMSEVIGHSESLIIEKGWLDCVACKQGQNP